MPCSCTAPAARGTSSPCPPTRFSTTCPNVRASRLRTLNFSIGTRNIKLNRKPGHRPLKIAMRILRPLPDGSMGPAPARPSSSPQQRRACCRAMQVTCVGDEECVRHPFSSQVQSRDQNCGTWRLEKTPNWNRVPLGSNPLLLDTHRNPDAATLRGNFQLRFCEAIRLRRPR